MPALYRALSRNDDCDSFAGVQGLVMVAAVLAQWTNPYTSHQFNNPLSSTLDTIINGKMQQRMLEKSIAARQAQPAAAPVAPAAHKTLAATDFKPAAKGHPTVDAFLSSPGLAPDARTTMRSVTDATFAALGQVRPNNVAMALAAALGTATIIVSGQPMSDAASAQLIQGVNDLLAGSPDFTRLKSRDKQAMYEKLVMTTALLAILQEGGKTSPDLRAQSLATAQGVLQKLTGSASGH
jgi:hypothetical protein